MGNFQQLSPWPIGIKVHMDKSTFIVVRPVVLIDRRTSIALVATASLDLCRLVVLFPCYEMKVKLKWIVNLATKIRTRRGSRARTETTEVASNEEVDEPGGRPRRKLFARIKKLFKRADRNPVGEDVLQENYNHPRVPAVPVGTPQLAERIPSTVILKDQTSVIPLSEDHYGHSPPITLGEGTIAGPSTLQPPLNRTGSPNYGPSASVSTEHFTVPLQRRDPRVPSSISPREGSLFTESNEDGDECDSVYYTPPSKIDSVYLHSSNANGSVEDVLALGHGHDHADEEVPVDIHSPIDRDSLGSSPAGIEDNNDPRTSRGPLVISERPIGPISETSTGSASPASPSSAPERPLPPRQLTWMSSGSSYFSLSRSQTEDYVSLSRSQTDDYVSLSRSQTDDYVSLSRSQTDDYVSLSRSQTDDYVSLSQSQTEESFSFGRSQTGGSCSPLSQFSILKRLPPNRSSSSDAFAGSLSQSLTLSSPDLSRRSINNFLPTELITRILSQCLCLPIGCFDGTLLRRMKRTCCQLRLVCPKWNDLIVSAHLIFSSVAPSSLSLRVPPAEEVLSWYTGQITRKSVVDNLSLPLRRDFGDSGPYHPDLDFLRVLSSAIPKCRALKVSLPLGLAADWLQPDNNNNATPMSLATPNLRYLSWTFNLPLSAPIPPGFKFPWFALRHVQHGLTWSLLTTVELDCPLTIEDCLFVLSEGRDNLECASFRTVDGLGEEWLSTITLLKLDSLSVEGVGDLGPLFSDLRMECHRRLGMTSHTRGEEVCLATPSPHALNVCWETLTHVDLFCHLTRSDLVRLMGGGLCNLVSFQWRGHLTPDADANASIPMQTLDRLTEVMVYSNKAGCEAILDILTESRTSLRKIIVDKHVMHFSAPPISLPGERASMRNHKLNEMKAALYSITLNDVEHPISISDAWAILSQCPQLKELDVRVAGCVPPSSGRRLAGDELSSDLQILKLDLDVPVSILFRNLSLPKLATLEMAFSRSNRMCAEGLDAALARWGCPLTRLLLRKSNIGEETIIKCLTSVSSTLKDLLIYGDGPRSGWTMGKLALKRLTLKAGLNHDLCPKLESLTLEPCVAPDGALAQLLRSKAPPLRCCNWMCDTCIEKIVPLRRVRVSFLKAVVPNMSDVREEDVKMIERLKTTGMDIELVD
ncbi:uncharacterized protein LACBIDRAFT_328124 [Laccaria bicolor S238N-H82]|uniref:Predicted protein n=1 Tax=Laccaria bicolor (strain S238N-H82 / ATCC MYA-4686) TaxID=486041 RepID=B0DDU3_LACBS|nr:uncharacterized protein LACBIDRAFT_328124 [Laccaria bicolor S238N-H82]EDR07277.1 predicted protein [Laccaria bicolor S238N-H82]|eukprot:XP_001882208.1 predicted protein [Laccaria bicolor S238N-H82]